MIIIKKYTIKKNVINVKNVIINIIDLIKLNKNPVKINTENFVKNKYSIITIIDIILKNFNHITTM